MYRPDAMDGIHKAHAPSPRASYYSQAHEDPLREGNNDLGEDKTPLAGKGTEIFSISLGESPSNLF